VERAFTLYIKRVKIFYFPPWMTVNNKSLNFCVVLMFSATRWDQNSRFWVFTVCQLDDRNPSSIFWQRQKSFLQTGSETRLTFYAMDVVDFVPGVKMPECDLLLPSSAEGKSEWFCNLLPHHLAYWHAQWKFYCILFGFKKTVHIIWTHFTEDQHKVLEFYY
jgi:hypothetical protein